MRNTHSLFISCGNVEMWNFTFIALNIAKIKNSLNSKH